MDKNTKQHLIDRLRERLLMTHESQSEVAIKIKVSQSMISQWLLGKSVPSNRAIIDNLICFLGDDPQDYA